MTYPRRGAELVLDERREDISQIAQRGIERWSLRIAQKLKPSLQFQDSLLQTQEVIFVKLVVFPQETGNSGHVVSRLLDGKGKLGDHPGRSHEEADEVVDEVRFEENPG